MHGAKPLTVPLLFQARFRPALPLSSPKTPMSPVVRSSWLLRAISSSDVPPDRPSRQGLSSSVIIGNKRKQGGWPPCPTAQVLLVRRLHTIVMPRERREGRRRRRTRSVSKRNICRVRWSSHLAAWLPGGATGNGTERVVILCLWGIPRWSVFRACSSPSSPRVPPVRRRHSPRPNQQQLQHKSTQHNTHPGRERERNKKKSRRAEALPTCTHSTAQHSTARCCSQRTPALLVTRKVRPARWRGREGTGEALSSVFRRNKPCEENIRIHRINSAVL